MVLFCTSFTCAYVQTDTNVILSRWSTGKKDKAVEERLSTVGKKAFTAIDLVNQPSLTAWLEWPPAYLIVCCLFCLECTVEKNPII